MSMNRKKEKKKLKNTRTHLWIMVVIFEKLNRYPLCYAWFKSPGQQIRFGPFIHASKQVAWGNRIQAICIPPRLYKLRPTYC